MRLLFILHLVMCAVCAVMFIWRWPNHLAWLSMPGVVWFGTFAFTMWYFGRRK